jgi:hypothetical protein
MTDEEHSAPDSAQIRFSPAASIVLFELLTRWCEEGNAPTPDASCFESTAEQAVLRELLADLEKQLVAPFRPDYGSLLDKARNRLKGAWDYTTLRG